MNTYVLQILYHLNVDGYHGTAGNSFTNHNEDHNGAPFTTIDNDNDLAPNDNCATLYKGAWWYDSCHASNLNGYNYGTNDSIPYGTGIIWYSFNGHYTSLKSDIMAIRPMYASP